jgi:peptide/nickel transport system substrate-binding protein
VVANPGPPAIERITFRFFEDPAARALALESNEVQVMGELLPTDAEDLAEFADIGVTRVPVPGQPLQFMVNTTRPPTDRLAVRQALLLGTDRATIIQTVFQGLSPVAEGPLSSPSLGYTSSLEDVYAYEPLQAELLLDEVELVDSDADGWRDLEGEPIVITVVVPPWGLSPEAAQLLESQWETTLQLQVEIRQVAEYTMLRDVAASGEYNLISFNLFGLEPILLNGFYTTTGFNNWMNISDPDLDALLLQAAIENNPTRRNELYARAQERIMERALIIPIREYVNLNGFSTEVSGLHFDTQGWFPYLTDLTLQESTQ